MTPDEAISHLSDAVRKAIPPTFVVEISDGRGGRNDLITNVRVIARVGTDRLLYDQPGLMELVGAESIEADDQHALLTGSIGLMRYRLDLYAEPALAV